MKTSKFSGAKLSRFKAVAKGAKIVPDARPELYLSGGINKFVINGTASTKMGLEHGMCVTILSDPDAVDVNEKYILIQTDAEHGNKLAAHKSETTAYKPLTFNCSILWSQMIQLTPDAEPKSEAALCQMGYMVERDTIKGRNGEMCKAVLAASRVTFTPREIAEVPAEIAGIPVIKAWELVDAKRFMIDENGKVSKFPVAEGNVENTQPAEAEEAPVEAAEENEL